MSAEIGRPAASNDARCRTLGHELNPNPAEPLAARRRQQLAEMAPGVACRTYAPVGGHCDLLAYLVRRLLENGATSSFVSMAADPDVPVEHLIERPVIRVGSAAKAANPHLPLPPDLYGAARKNSTGVEFGHRESLEAFLALARRDSGQSFRAVPLIDGKEGPGVRRDVTSPVDGKPVGQVSEADDGGARHDKRRARGAGLGRDVCGRARPMPRARRRPDRGPPWPLHGAASGRSRQDAGRRARRDPRGGRFLPLLCGAGEDRLRRGRATARTCGRGLPPRATGTRRFRLHQPLELPARHLRRAGDGGARGRQCSGRQARRADTAHRLRGGGAPA